MAQEKNRGGAPSKYQDLAPIIVERYRAGSTLIESARLAGVSYSTLLSWRKQYPDFAAQLDEARRDYLAVVQEEVELSLYQRAKGMVIYTVKEEAEVLPDGTEVITKRVRMAKKIAPDPSAATLVLSSLDPDKWATRLGEMLYTSDGKPINLNLNQVDDTPDANDQQTQSQD